MSVKTPFTDEIEIYRKYVRMAEAEVEAGNHRMSAYLEGYFKHLLSLRMQEDDWLKTGS